jgi:hypothetical protein
VLLGPPPQSRSAVSSNARSTTAENPTFVPVSDGPWAEIANEPIPNPGWTEAPLVNASNRPPNPAVPLTANHDARQPAPTPNAMPSCPVMMPASDQSSTRSSGETPAARATALHAIHDTGAV